MFNFLQHHSTIRNVFCAVLALSLFAVIPPPDTHAAPVIAVIVAVAATAAAVVIYDFNSCGLNWFWGCSNGRRSGGGGGGGGGFFNNTFRNRDGRNSNRNTNTNTNTGTSATPQRCNNSTANACGMTEVRYALPGQTCDITPIPNSRCPIPTISDNSFYADPTLVRHGNQTGLNWQNISNATNCMVTGGGLAVTDFALGITGNIPSPPITQKTIFTLTCRNGAGGPQASKEATVNLVPTFQEI